MGTDDMAMLDKKTEQKETISSSLEEEPRTVLGSPIDFLNATPSQFGITVQSFNQSSTERKEKSRLAQLRERRKSSIGVRGSPEMNSLIRFIARQKMKNSSNCQTPELVKGSPFLPRVASTLKQKIASFNSLMGVEESEAYDLMPRQGNNTSECIKTRDYLSDKYDQEEGKENKPQEMSPAPSKKRRVGPIEGCEVQIREAHTPDIHFNESYKGDKEPMAECNDTVSKGPLLSIKTEEEASRKLLCTPRHDHLERPMTFSSQNNQQQDNEFEPQSPSRAQRSDLTSASPVKSFSAFQFSPLSPQLEMKSADKNNSTGISVTATKKKRVHFGCPLSPELFDNQLPPSTPLRKGGTPARTLTPGGILKMHSALKTPQRDGYCTPQAQPELISEFGASPVLAMSHNRRIFRMAEDGVEKWEKIIFPSKEETDSADMTDTDSINYAQLNLNEAFCEELLSPEVTTVKSETSQASQLNAPNELLASSEEKQPEAVRNATARLRNREKKAVAQSESTHELPAARRRKRKLPEESKPVRRSTRSAAKPSETIKTVSKAANRWKKEVNHSLYGSREYASKKPTLSPITELFICESAAAQHTPPTTCTDENSFMQNEPSESSSSCPRTAACNEESPTGPPLSPSKRAIGKKRRSSRYEVTKCGFKKVNVSLDSIYVEPQLAESESHEEESTTIVALLKEAPPENLPPEKVSASTEEHHTLTIGDTPSTHTDTNTEVHLIEDDATPACLLGGEQTSTVTAASPKAATQLTQNVSRCKRRSVNLTDNQPKQEVEKNTVSKSDYPEEATQVNSGLTFYQTDFNFEDVFKRVPSRGQRSVRRSLRNLSNSNDDTGLAWVPQTSPEFKTITSRKTRSRRSLSALSEDTTLIT
ncbi:cell division cycle-associated protein 2 isoform X3 [Corythoichthys intestinalis]|uniref:cell division cycle-associated protein 2 isoform X3 n=1 Tax=Corythoichthys intestinalis TaxID=161448 RepID=UPI0025A512A6|nr:cell division cycle-associated protein 2 isoform X3 [Corythoichthys intestinalis]